MSVERRLHHAARELRGVEIDPPQLSVGGRPKRSLAITVGPLLGACFAVVLGIALLRTPGTESDPIAATEPATPVEVVAGPDSLPTPVQELALIRSLSGTRSVVAVLEPAQVVRAPAGAS